MIGNDIVDLQLAQKESNWKRPRFLQKLFTEQEQHFIHSAPNKDVAVWMLWSKKESAYKIIARLEKRRFFTPKKLETVNIKTDFTNPFSQYIGQVTFKEYTLFTKSVITDTYIHTIAQWNNCNKPLATDCFYMAQNNYVAQQQITRRNLLQRYAEKTKFSVTDLTVKKDDYKIPRMYYKNEKQLVQISISHHGHYGGYVLL